MPRSKPAPVSVAAPSAAKQPSEPAVNQAPAPRLSASERLVEKARRARGQGDIRQAMALLERAQRISPQNASIYREMAITAQQLGDNANARAIAERGLLYCQARDVCLALESLARGG